MTEGGERSPVVKDLMDGLRVHNFWRNCFSRCFVS